MTDHHTAQPAPAPTAIPQLTGWRDRLRRLWFHLRKHAYMTEHEHWDGRHL